jgi:sugar phosphate permease
MGQSLARKRWYRIIPVVFVTYSLAYIDRTNFGFAAAGGMAGDLNITASMLSLLGSMFFLGYFFFQIPGTIYAANKSTKRLIFWSLISWGSLATATGLVSNVKFLYVIRFLLGVVESAVWPSMIVLLSRWFTSHERSRANTFLTLGNPVTIIWMSVLSGYLIKSVGWRWMFIVEGLPAVIWAFFWWKLIDDKPDHAGWLTENEKRTFNEQLTGEQQLIKPVRNYKEAFKSKVVILLCIQYTLWSLGAYGFIMWLPSIIKAAPDMSIVKTGWLAAVPYLFAIIGMFVTSYFSDKSLNRKDYIWPFQLTGSVAFFGSYMAGSDNFWLSFGLLVIAGIAIYAPYAPFFTALTEILPVNVSAGAIALINSTGAFGSFSGAYLAGYLNGITKGFGASYILMACSLLLASLLTIIAIRRRRADLIIASET